MEPLTKAAIFAVCNVALIATAGFFLRKKGVIQKEAESSIVALLVKFLMPCLIFTSMASSKEFTSVSDIVIPLSLPIFYAPALLAVCHFVSGFLSKDLLPDMTARRSFSIGCYMQNYGYLPLTLLVILDPQNRYLGTLFLHNTGIEIILWAMTSAYLSGGRDISFKKVLNPPVIAVFAGMAFNLCGLVPHIPEFILGGMARVGAAAVPIGITMVGVTIYGILEEKSSGLDAKDLQLGLVGLFLRLGCFPLVLIALGFLPFVPENVRVILVVQAAMPSTVFGLILIRFFGGKPSYALPVLLATSFVSLLTTPFWIRLACDWLKVSF